MKLFDIDTYREIIDTIRRNKGRSLLTGFGIFWGVFMLMLLSGGGQGVKALVGKQFEGFASNSAVIATEKTGKAYMGLQKGRRWHLHLDDVDRLRAQVPELECVMPSISFWGKRITRGEQVWNGSVKCNSPEYAVLETPNLKYGRYINEMDILQQRKVCVIGHRVYEKLFPEGGDPCGQYVQVDSLQFKVVGMDMNDGNISINGNSSQSIIVPYSFARTAYNFGTRVDIICFTVKEGVSLKEVMPKVRRVIYRANKIHPDDERALFSVNVQLIFGLMDSMFRGISFIIWLVGLGTLLAGAIGVSNIMMVSVKERTIEIGIRRAIGATPANILSQIVMESVLLTMVSGMMGICLAVWILAALQMGTGQPFQVSFALACTSAALLVLLGVLASLAPALRAMGIKPVDAMRDE